MKRLVLVVTMLFVPLVASAQFGHGPGPGGGGDCPCALRGDGGPSACKCHEGGPGLGQCGCGMRHGGMHLLGRCLLDSPEIGLSADQRKQIEAIRDEEISKFRAERPKITPADLLRAFADPKVSKADLKKMHEAMHAERKALMDQKIEAMMRVRDVLTPEQLAKLPAVCGGPAFGPDWPPPAE